MSVLVDAFGIPIERVFSQYHDDAGPIERQQLKKVLEKLRVCHENESKLTEVFWMTAEFAKEILSSALNGNRSHKEWETWRSEWTARVSTVEKALKPK